MASEGEARVSSLSANVLVDTRPAAVPPHDFSAYDALGIRGNSISISTYPMIWMVLSPPRIAYTDAKFQIQVKVTHVVVSRLAMRLAHVIERNPSVIVNATHDLCCQAPSGDRPSALQQGLLSSPAFQSRHLPCQCATTPCMLLLL